MLPLSGINFTLCGLQLRMPHHCYIPRLPLHSTRLQNCGRRTLWLQISFVHAHYCRRSTPTNLNITAAAHHTCSSTPHTVTIVQLHSTVSAPQHCCVSTTLLKLHWAAAHRCIMQVHFTSSQCTRWSFTETLQNLQSHTQLQLHCTPP